MPIAIPNSPILKFNSPAERRMETIGRIQTTAYEMANQEAIVVNRLKFISTVSIF